MQQTVGSSVRRLKGKWQAIIRVKVQGKWKQVDTKYGFKTKAEANNWISKNISKYTKTYQINGYEDITLRELKEIYLEYQKDKVKASSHNLICNQLKDKTMLEDRKIKTLTKMDFDLLTKEIKSQAKLMRYKILFNFAIDTLEIDMRNPAREINLNTKSNKEIIVITNTEFENEIKPLIKNYKNRFFLDMAFYTGLRGGEIAGLTYNDIFPTYLKVNKQFCERTNTFEIPKSANGIRTVPISNKLYDKIIEFRKHDKISTIDNKIFRLRFAKKYANDNLVKVTKGTKFEGITTHSLRHSYATNLITNGIDVKTVSVILGDNIETVLKIYSHYSEQGYAKVEKLINGI